MRPDRIIVGEVRGAEVMDMLQAMNTGHEGSMSTIHANTARDALTRLEAMLGMSGVPLSESGNRQMISRGLDVIVQLSRGVDGKRRVTSIAEITGMEGPVITLQEIYKFEQTTVDANRQVQGRFVATQVRPRAMKKIESYGIEPQEVAKPFLPG
jgi:pilus assembly protein CpaF